MNLSMHVALVNELSNGSGNGCILFKSESHVSTVGIHSTGVFRNFGPCVRSNTGYSMYEPSEGEAAEKAVRKTVFINGDTG